MAAIAFCRSAAAVRSKQRADFKAAFRASLASLDMLMKITMGVFR